MKVSTENNKNFGYEKIKIVVDNIPVTGIKKYNTELFHKPTTNAIFVHKIYIYHLWYSINWRQHNFSTIFKLMSE